MAFKQVVTLFAEKHISLVKDQKSIVGTFLGTTSGPNQMNPGKLQYKHFFKTENGIVAVWGMTNLDMGLRSVKPGSYTRATFSHQAKSFKPGRQGMKMFTVEVDNDLFEDVGDLSLQTQNSEEPTNNTGYSDAEGNDEGQDLSGENDDLSNTEQSHYTLPVASRTTATQSVAPKVPSSAADLQAKAAAVLARSKAAAAGVKRA